MPGAPRTSTNLWVFHSEAHFMASGLWPLASGGWSLACPNPRPQAAGQQVANTAGPQGMKPGLAKAGQQSGCLLRVRGEGDWAAQPPPKPGIPAGEGHFRKVRRVFKYATNCQAAGISAPPHGGGTQRRDRDSSALSHVSADHGLETLAPAPACTWPPHPLARRCPIKDMTAGAQLGAPAPPPPLAVVQGGSLARPAAGEAMSEARRQGPVR